MRWNRKSFGMKLWSGFALFTAIIFIILWLLQTVFLQNFYNSMAIDNIKNVARQIKEHQNDENLTEIINDYAYHSALLIFLTDWAGNVIYSADEHNSLYQHQIDGSGSAEVQLNSEISALHNLPLEYNVFLEKLENSDNDIGYALQDNRTYVYGMKLSPSSENGKVLYISMHLGVVGATVDILRIQLIWVTFLSLVLGFAIAYFISKRFAQPVAAISLQAKRMAQGNFSGGFNQGFCLELDELSDTLEYTAVELERLENSRRELLGNVSHDLRTPLTMIKGYAEMVKEISWSDGTQRNEDLSIIIRETDRLTGLVNDILTYFDRPTANQPKELVNLSALAKLVVAQFKPLCLNKKCEIQKYLEPRQFVLSNEKELTRVLYNLIDNAIHHTGENGRISVYVKNQEKTVRVEIQDYGKGILPDELPYIWDRYFTAKQREYNGTSSGLGLAIVKDILLAQEAEFGVDSKVGEGSTFWFELEKKGV